jgi:L-threonylcarbamoyladenylate synthase
MSTRVIRVGKDADAAAAAAQGAAALKRGLLVAFPTETVYGLAAVATNEKAMERLRELKNRPARPFSVHLGRPEDARRYVKDLSPAARRLMAKAWPGPLSLVVPVGGRLASPRLE